MNTKNRMKLISAFVKFVIVALFVYGFVRFQVECIDGETEYRDNLIRASQSNDAE